MFYQDLSLKIFWAKLPIRLAFTDKLLYLPLKLF